MSCWRWHDTQSLDLQALLTISWPEALQFHARSGVRLSPGAAGKPDPGISYALPS